MKPEHTFQGLTNYLHSMRLIGLDEHVTFINDLSPISLWITVEKS